MDTVYRPDLRGKKESPFLWAHSLYGRIWLRTCVSRDGSALIADIMVGPFCLLMIAMRRWRPIMVHVNLVNITMVNVTMVNVNIMVGPFCGVKVHHRVDS